VRLARLPSTSAVGGRLERQDEWHWATADGGYLGEDEFETFELLREVEATLKWLVPRSAPVYKAGTTGMTTGAAWSAQQLGCGRRRDSSQPLHGDQ